MKNKLILLAHMDPHVSASLAFRQNLTLNKSLHNFSKYQIKTPFINVYSNALTDDSAEIKSFRINKEYNKILEECKKTLIEYANNITRITYNGDDLPDVSYIPVRSSDFTNPLVPKDLNLVTYKDVRSAKDDATPHVVACRDFTNQDYITDNYMIFEGTKLQNTGKAKSSNIQLSLNNVAFDYDKNSFKSIISSNAFIDELANRRVFTDRGGKSYSSEVEVIQKAMAGVVKDSIKQKQQKSGNYSLYYFDATMNYSYNDTFYGTMFAAKLEEIPCKVINPKRSITVTHTNENSKNLFLQYTNLDMSSPTASPTDKFKKLDNKFYNIDFDDDKLFEIYSSAVERDTKVNKLTSYFKSNPVDMSSFFLGYDEESRVNNNNEQDFPFLGVEVTSPVDNSDIINYVTHFIYSHVFDSTIVNNNKITLCQSNNVVRSGAIDNIITRKENMPSIIKQTETSLEYFKVITETPGAALTDLIQSALYDGVYKSKSSNKCVISVGFTSTTIDKINKETIREKLYNMLIKKIQPHLIDISPMYLPEMEVTPFRKAFCIIKDNTQDGLDLLDTNKFKITLADVGDLTEKLNKSIDKLNLITYARDNGSLEDTTSMRDKVSEIFLGHDVNMLNLLFNRKTNMAAKRNVLSSIATDTTTEGYVSESTMYSGGLSMFDKDVSLDRINVEKKDVKNSLGLRPKLGVTGFSVKTKGNFGQLRIATLNLKAFTLDQLKTVQSLYMRPGIYLFVEWGWSICPDNLINDNKIATEFQNIKLVPNTSKIDFFLDKNTYPIMNQLTQTFIENTGGHYDSYFGVVTNFNWTMNESGEYDITINLVDKGTTILALNMTKSANFNSAYDLNIFGNFENLFNVNIKDNANYKNLETTILNAKIGPEASQKFSHFVKFNVKEGAPKVTTTGGGRGSKSIDTGSNKRLKEFRKLLTSKDTNQTQLGNGLYYHKITLYAKDVEIPDVNFSGIFKILELDFSNYAFWKNTLINFKQLFASDTEKTEEHTIYFPIITNPEVKKFEDVWDLFMKEQNWDDTLDEKYLLTLAILDAKKLSPGSTGNLILGTWKHLVTPLVELEKNNIIRKLSDKYKNSNETFISIYLKTKGNFFVENIAAGDAIQQPTYIFKALEAGLVTVYQKAFQYFSDKVFNIKEWMTAEILDSKISGKAISDLLIADYKNIKDVTNYYPTYSAVKEYFSGTGQFKNPEFKLPEEDKKFRYLLPSQKRNDPPPGTPEFEMRANEIALLASYNPNAEYELLKLQYGEYVALSSKTWDEFLKFKKLDKVGGITLGGGNSLSTFNIGGGGDGSSIKTTTPHDPEELTKKHGGYLPYYMSFQSLLKILNDDIMKGTPASIELSDLGLIENTHYSKDSENIYTVSKTHRSNYKKNYHNAVLNDMDIEIKNIPKDDTTKVKTEKSSQIYNLRIRDFNNKMKTLKKGNFQGIDWQSKIPTKTYISENFKLTSIDIDKIIFLTNDIITSHSNDFDKDTEQVSIGPGILEKDISAEQIKPIRENINATDYISKNNILKSTFISCKYIKELINSSQSLDSFFKQLCTTISNASSGLINLTMVTEAENNTTNIRFYDSGLLFENNEDIHPFSFSTLSTQSILKKLSLSAKLPTQFQTVAFVGSSRKSGVKGSDRVNDILDRFSDGSENNDAKLNYLDEADEPPNKATLREAAEDANKETLNKVMKAPLDKTSFEGNDGFISYYMNKINKDYDTEIKAYYDKKQLSNKDSRKNQYVFAPIGIDLSFDLDGISGIRWSNIITLDYLPHGLENAKFQVIELTDNITSGEWTTTVRCILRSLSES